MKYIVPKIFCALGAIAIFAGIFLSEINITLGNMLQSGAIAVVITAVLLLLVIWAFHLKKTNNMIRFRIYRKLEYLSVFLFVVAGLASLLIFNHCITVWQQTGRIQESMNIRQLENLLPEYENYANQRIANYKVQLDEVVLYRQSRSTESLTNLGFEISSIEDLNSQKTRKIDKLKQVVYPHIFEAEKKSITDSIAWFVNIVEDFSPFTAPKNIVTIEQWAKSWETKLTDFSRPRMKGENAEDFVFNSEFGNVKQILTEWQDFDNPKRYWGYFIGIAVLICMLFPYFKVKRTNKLNF
jgi:hypothetical protein